MDGDNQAVGWFKATRGEVPIELIRANPCAFVLAYVIAARARWNDGFNRHNLEIGEAFLGDYREYGMSERQYRTAKEQLQKWNFATFKTTNRGTIAKLIDSRLFSTVAGQSDGQNDTQATDSRRTADGQATTNKEYKNIRTEEFKKGEPAAPGQKHREAKLVTPCNNSGNAVTPSCNAPVTQGNACNATYTHTNTQIYKGEGTPPGQKLSAADTVKFDGELKRITSRLSKLGKPGDYASNSTTRKEIETLSTRLTELRKILGVTA